MTGRRYVVIGAGVVGAAVADELTARGAADVTVLDKGPLYATGGSSSHAPGLVSRTSPSRMMQALADYTVDKFTGLDLDGAPAMLPVGTLEVARNEPRLRELQRRWNATTAWGFRGRMVEPAEITDLWPIIDTAGLVGGYVTEGEGLAVALRAVEAQARTRDRPRRQVRGGHRGHRHRAPRRPRHRGTRGRRGHPRRRGGLLRRRMGPHGGIDGGAHAADAGARAPVRHHHRRCPRSPPTRGTRPRCRSSATTTRGCTTATTATASGSGRSTIGGCRWRPPASTPTSAGRTASSTPSPRRTSPNPGS